MKKTIISILSLFVILLAYSCSDSDNYNVEVTAELPMLDIANLREAPYKMGATVVVEALKEDANYRNLLIKEASSITAENAMKMSTISKSKGVYDFTDADYIVNFASENNMRVHGHTLIWHQNLPSWVQSFSGDKEAWEAMMKGYIEDVVTHFKGKVASWDVVNEAISDDGTMRPTVWLQNIGPEYISLAFQYAHAADPDAILFYNEYGQEYSHAKHVGINKLVDQLLAAKVPLHGMGLQMHTNINIEELRLKYPIKAAASRNLLVHISELDVAVNPDEIKDLIFTKELAEKQQASYRYIAQGMMEIPAELRFGITFWGITDKYSWLTERPDWALPFDINYERKLAYNGILQGLYK